MSLFCRQLSRRLICSDESVPGKELPNRAWASDFDPVATAPGTDSSGCLNFL